MIKIALVLSLLVPMQVALPARSNPGPPELVNSCLEQSEVKGKVELRTTKKPYFLKGDFDGDGFPDYAVAIRGTKTHRNGVIICTTKNKAFILGADTSKDPPFSDLPGDNFVAPSWKVMSRQEALKIYNYDGNKPVRAAAPKGDSVAMIWEDAICLIYWNGTQYRWGCGQ